MKRPLQDCQSQQEYNSKNFIEIAGQGNIEAIKDVINFHEVPQNDYNKAFYSAAENGHIEVLKFLTRMTENQKIVEGMIHYNDDFAFYKAAINNQVEVLEFLLDLTPNPEVREKMIHSNNDIAFRAAAGNGHIEILKFLTRMTENQKIVEGIIHSNEDFAFYKAAINNQVEALKFLLELTPNQEKREKMIHCDKDIAFRIAAKNGHIEVLKFLIDLTPNQKIRERMIHSSDDYAFSAAAEKGQIEVLKLLLDLTPDLEMKRKMIHKEHRSVFSLAIALHYTPMVKYLFYTAFSIPKPLANEEVRSIATLLAKPQINELIQMYISGLGSLYPLLEERQVMCQKLRNLEIAIKNFPTLIRIINITHITNLICQNGLKGFCNQKFLLSHTPAEIIEKIRWFIIDTPNQDLDIVQYTFYNTPEQLATLKDTGNILPFLGYVDQKEVIR